ncbi:hypothetical protein PCE1_003951 [Barthelona sp. PCE]
MKYFSVVKNSFEEVKIAFLRYCEDKSLKWKKSDGIEGINDQCFYIYTKEANNNYLDLDTTERLKYIYQNDKVFGVIKPEEFENHCIVILRDSEGIKILKDLFLDFDIDFPRFYAAKMGMFNDQIATITEYEQLQWSTIKKKPFKMVKSTSDSEGLDLEESSLGLYSEIHFKINTEVEENAQSQKQNAEEFFCDSYRKEAIYTPYAIGFNHTETSDQLIRKIICCYNNEQLPLDIVQPCLKKVSLENDHFLSYFSCVDEVELNIPSEMIGEDNSVYCTNKIGFLSLFAAMVAVERDIDSSEDLIINLSTVLEYFDKFKQIAECFRKHSENCFFIAKFEGIQTRPIRFSTADGAPLQQNLIQNPIRAISPYHHGGANGFDTTFRSKPIEAADDLRSWVNSILDLSHPNFFILSCVLGMLMKHLKVGGKIFLHNVTVLHRVDNVCVVYSDGVWRRFTNNFIENINDRVEQIFELSRRIFEDIFPEDSIPLYQSKNMMKRKEDGKTTKVPRIGKNWLPKFKHKHMAESEVNCTIALCKQNVLLDKDCVYPLDGKENFELCDILLFDRTNRKQYFLHVKNDKDDEKVFNQLHTSYDMINSSFFKMNDELKDKVENSIKNRLTSTNDDSNTFITNSDLNPDKYCFGVVFVTNLPTRVFEGESISLKLSVLRAKRIIGNRFILGTFPAQHAEYRWIEKKIPCIRPIIRMPNLSDYNLIISKKFCNAILDDETIFYDLLKDVNDNRLLNSNLVYVLDRSINERDKYSMLVLEFKHAFSCNNGQSLLHFFVPIVCMMVEGKKQFIPFMHFHSMCPLEYNPHLNLSTVISDLVERNRHIQKKTKTPKGCMFYDISNEKWKNELFEIVGAVKHINDHSKFLHPFKLNPSLNRARRIQSDGIDPKIQATQ